MATIPISYSLSIVIAMPIFSKNRSAKLMDRWNVYLFMWSLKASSFIHEYNFSRIRGLN